MGVTREQLEAAPVPPAAAAGKAEQAMPVAHEPQSLTERERLGDFLRNEFSDEIDKRVQSYFAIIDAIEGNTQAASRRKYFDALITRIQRLSQAVNDERPIEATVVIPVFEHVAYTVAAVFSLLEHAATTRYEIIIGNDVSTDETAEVFGAIGGVVRCITHAVNEGFTRNCNLSARHANGAYIVLLNNDTFVLDGWIDELLAPFKRLEHVGLTGSKLLMPDGTLQEAGGIIWRDASGWNFGRGQEPTLPEFNYLKDADYISGAAIAIPKRFWDEIGGFDERYRPAYFEDTDLAFTLRAKGLRTLYAPASQIIHHEGITHGTDVAAGIKAFQETNRAKFIEKWRSVLAAEQFANGERVFLARDRSRHRKHILVIDHCLPQPDRDTGSQTASSCVKMFVDAGMQVSFWPDHLYRDKVGLKPLQDLGVEVLYGPRLVGRFPQWFAERGRYFDYVFLNLPHLSTKYVDSIRQHSAAKIIYNDYNLPHERLRQELTAMSSSGKPWCRIFWWRIRKLWMHAKRLAADHRGAISAR